MRTMVGLVGVMLVLATMTPRAAALRLEDPDTLLAPTAATANPTVLMVGPGQVGTDHPPYLTISVDGAEVRPALARRRLGGRWVWAVTIPARAGTVVVARADRWGAIELARFAIVDQVAAPRLQGARLAIVGDDVVDQWSTCRTRDGIALPSRDLIGPCRGPGLEAFRANGEVVRFELLPVPSPLVPARARLVWPWLVIGGLLATAALLVAWRRRPRVAL